MNQNDRIANNQLNEEVSPTNSNNSFETIEVIDGSEEPSSVLKDVNNVNGANVTIEITNSLDQARVINYEPPLNLPVAVQRRIRALKKIQLEIYRLEKKFYTEVHALEQKYYEEQQKSKYAQRAEIVRTKPAMPLMGISGFWLRTLMNAPLVREIIEPHDMAVLNHLQDIITEYSDSGFALNFVFAPNSYFTNDVLRLEFELRYSPDRSSFGGPIISSCKGCQINWCPTKNVTLFSYKKIKRHRQTGKRRVVIKHLYQPSLFHMFAAPSTTELDTVTDADEFRLLMSYAELGYYIKDRIVTRAVLYFTGEVLEEAYEQARPRSLIKLCNNLFGEPPE